MITVKMTREFEQWLTGIRDGMARLRLARRLERVSHGNFGDVASVGDGVYEMREHFGPGWRMYYVQRGHVLVLMLGGGDKRTQVADIATAKARAAQWVDEYEGKDRKGNEGNEQ